MEFFELNRREIIKLAGIAGAASGFTACRRMIGMSTAAFETLAATPPMGWNSFDSYGVYLHETAARANIDAMAEKLQPHGYEYFVVDNGWFGEYKLFPGTKIPAEKHASDVKINQYGLLQPSHCYFPNGLKPLIDRCHEKGLKFGVHLMRGIPRKAVEANTPIKNSAYSARDIADTTSTCTWCAYNYGVDMSKPGAQQFYNSLVDQLAGWGVDLIKADDIVPFPDEVKAMAEAIAQCGRPIVLSLSPGGSVDPAHIDAFRTGNMLRVTRDIWDEQEGIDICFDAWRKWQGKEGPGFWIDMDMIPFGNLCLMSPPEYASAKGHGGKIDENENLVALAGRGTTRHSLFTRPQMITFMTLRALSASPLMVGGDLPTMDEFSLSLLTNAEMIACNQNGVMGHPVSESGGIEVWNTPEGHTNGSGWAGIFNRTDSPTIFDATNASLGLDPERAYNVTDVWNNRRFTLNSTTPFNMKVESLGAALIRYKPD
jgi:alpha-galactosidase